MNAAETAEEMITRLTNEAIDQRIPCMIYVGLLSAMGVIGNIHVLILFSQRDVKASTYTVFVKVLALIDLATSLIAMPMEIFDLTRPYTFQSSLGCKIFRLFNSFLSMASISILVLIAFERYRRVVNPLKRQMAVSVSRWLCLIVLSISFVLTVPAVIVTGQHTIHIESNGTNATGYMCFIDDNAQGTLFLYSYLGFLILLFVCLSAILIVAYLSIARVVFSRQNRFNKKQNPTDSGKAIKSVSGEIKESTTEINIYQNVSTASKMNLQKSTLKTTRPLIFITAIFIVVIAPWLILQCLISFVDDFKTNLNNFELTLHQIGIRLLLINNVCNPFVYGLTDNRFKQRIKSFYCGKKN